MSSSPATGVPVATLFDFHTLCWNAWNSAYVKLCKLRTPQDWKEREERKKSVCMEVEMGSREEECKTFDTSPVAVYTVVSP